MISGSLLINKQVGLTSRQEVNNISRRFNEKKVGHIGTLDPFADGLLIVLLGRSTKIAPFLEVMDKKYIASLKLGEKTETGDLTGNVVETSSIPDLDEEFIKDILNSFIGKQEQIPPIYSAIKINGKEAYKYAREGKEVKLKSRTINIYNIKYISFMDNILTFEAHVSKGTYIRTLGEDIAKKLGCVGHLIKLTRTAIGNFDLSNAKTSDNVTQNDLIPISKMLSHLPSYEVEGELEKKASNGMHFRLPILDEIVLIKSKQDVIALYKREQNGVYSCLRGFR